MRASSRQWRGGTIAANILLLFERVRISSAVRRRIPIVCLLVLSVLGTGAQWDLLQVFAWGRMIVNHSRSMTLIAAVETTFDGETCGLCRAVQRAKEQEASHSPVPALKVDGKILLFFQTPVPVIVVAPPLDGWRRADSVPPEEIGFPPPVPPPRQVLT